MSIKTYYKEVVTEMQNVVWPSRKHTLVATATVILLSVLVAGYLFGADYVFKDLLTLILQKK